MQIHIMLVCLMALTSKCFGNQFIHYAFVADTQLWWECSGDNKPECQAKGGQSTREQSLHSNEETTRVIKEMTKRSSGFAGYNLKGLVINGDLTAFGHEDEFGSYRKYWQDSFKDIIYPGLGNHDYANNVNDCYNNNCAKRLCYYITQWFQERMNNPYTKLISIDYTTHTYMWYVITRKTKYAGSLAYQWFEPVGRTKIFFFQLHYHPAYDTEIDSGEPAMLLIPEHAKHFNYALTAFAVRPSLKWLEVQLGKLAPGDSVVLNQHHHFEKSDTKYGGPQLIQVLNKFPKLKFLALFFGHLHNNVGVREYFKAAGQCVPAIFSGSVPNMAITVVKFRDNSDNMYPTAMESVELVKFRNGKIEHIPIPIKVDGCN